MMQKLSGNAVDSDASPCKSWSFSPEEDFVATAPCSFCSSPPSVDDASKIILFLLAVEMVEMLLQLYLLLVARIPEEEEEEEELQRKDDDDEEVEEEDIALLVLLAMFVLLVSIVVAADANMTRYNLSAAYRYFLFFCLTCARYKNSVARSNCFFSKKRVDKLVVDILILVASQAYSMVQKYLQTSKKSIIFISPSKKF